MSNPVGTWKNDKFVLTEPMLVVLYPLLEKPMQLLRISPGFETDGTSIPRFFWRIGTPFEASTIRASVVHDSLYSTQLTTRKYADQQFYNLLREDKCNVVKAWLYYRAVRIGGWKPWNAHKREDIEYNLQFVHLKNF